MKHMSVKWAKKELLAAASALLFYTILCGVLYTGVVTGLSQLLFPHKANGSIIEVDGKTYGSELLGQQYTGKNYMWGRITNLDLSTYQAEDGEYLMYAAPSNISPASEAYKTMIQERLQMIREYYPNTDNKTVPVDLVTCSGSGLDPHISPAAAQFQVTRLAAERNMTEEEIRSIIESCTNKKLFGILGEETVNVLKVNLMLDGTL